MKTSSSFHADSFRFKLTSETATGAFRQLPAQVSNADSKRGTRPILVWTAATERKHEQARFEYTHLEG